MAWVAVDKDSSEGIFRSKPERMNNWWLDKRYTTDDDESWYDSVIPLPKGTIKKLIGKELTWQDEPVELKEE